MKKAPRRVLFSPVAAPPLFLKRESQFAERRAEILVLQVVFFDACEQPVTATHRNFKQLGHAEVELCRKVCGKERVFRLETIFIALVHEVDAAATDANWERNGEHSVAEYNRFGKNTV